MWFQVADVVTVQVDTKVHNMVVAKMPICGIFKNHSVSHTSLHCVVARSDLQTATHTSG